MRLYTIQELETLKAIEKRAEAKANRAYRVTSKSADLVSASWNNFFHEEIERQGVAAGLKKPRSFFERRGK